MPALRFFASRAAERNRQGYISSSGYVKDEEDIYFIGDN